MELAIVVWVCVPLSLALSVIGIRKKQYGLVLAGAAVFLPITLYLNDSRDLYGYAVLLSLLHVGSAAAVSEDNSLWAWLLLVPGMIVGIGLFCIITINTA